MRSVVRPVLAAGVEPARHVGGTRVPSPYKRPRKGSVAFSVDTAVGTGAKMDDKRDMNSQDGKEDSDGGRNDGVAMSKECDSKSVTLETR